MEYNTTGLKKKETGEKRDVTMERHPNIFKQTPK